MFGELIRGHRQRQAMTQEELASRAGISARHIRDLEAGRIVRPRPGTVRLVADALGLGGVDRERFHQAAVGPTTDGVSGTPAAPTGVGPAQLPIGVRGFVGRTSELAQLDAALAMVEQADSAVVLALSGTAGVGKTTLAVHWAHRVRDRFPHGQLYVNLRGFDPSGSVLPPTEALGALLEALGASPERIPAGLAARSALYRSLLAGRRFLVVLDNARDGAQVRPLLAGSPGSLVVVTSRDAMTGLVAAVGAAVLAIDLMTPAEARRLLVHRLGGQRVAAERAAVDAIIHHCARLPLALAVAAARAGSRPGLSLTALAAELAVDNGALDRFADPDPAADVRAVFSWSYRKLSAPAARMFRLLGAHPGPHFGVPAAASLPGVDTAAATPVLDELARINLITEIAPHRYALHDLLRAYAAELAGANTRSRDAARCRILDHYLRTACAAGRQIQPSRDQIPLPAPKPGITVPDVPARTNAMSWFDTERPVLLAAVREAAATGQDWYAWQLAWAIATYLDRRGLWWELAATQETALAAARRLGDRLGETEATRLLGLACLRLGRYAEAEIHLNASRDLALALDDPARQGHCRMNLAQVSARQGDHVDALSHAQQAHSSFKVAGHRYGQANALNAIGWYHTQLHEYREALVFGAQALPLLQEIGDVHGQAAAWDTLGYAHQRLGDVVLAVTHYQRAVELYEEVGDRFFAADSLVHLGDAHGAAGDRADACRAWRGALAVLDELGHPSAEAVRKRLAGDG